MVSVYNMSLAERNTRTQTMYELLTERLEIYKKEHGVKINPAELRRVAKVYHLGYGAGKLVATKLGIKVTNK